MKNTNCSWCNKQLTPEHLKQITPVSINNHSSYKICSVECRIQTEQFIRYADTNGKRFLIMIGVVVLAYIVLTILTILLKYEIMIAFALGIPTFLLGATLYKYPFATPETIGYWGFRKSIKVGRISGIIIMIAGIAALIIAGFMLL